MKLKVNLKVLGIILLVLGVFFFWSGMDLKGGDSSLVKEFRAVWVFSGITTIVTGIGFIKVGKELKKLNSVGNVEGSKT